MNDSINRAEAIEAIESIVSVARTMDDGLILIDKADVLAELMKMPPAQPEIVRCRDCEHNRLPATSANADCEIFYGMTDQYGFCHMAERREVENERSD